MNGAAAGRAVALGSPGCHLVVKYPAVGCFWYSRREKAGGRPSVDPPPAAERCLAMRPRRLVVISSAKWPEVREGAKVAPLPHDLGEVVDRGGGEEGGVPGRTYGQGIPRV